MGPQGIGGGEKKRRGEWGGILWDRRMCGGMCLAFPPPTGAQGACWGPGPGPPLSEAMLNLRPPRPPPPRAFSGHMGPKPRPFLPPKPCPCLSPIPHSQGLFWLFFFPLFCYCGSILPYSCCFIYIFFSNISVSFLILFYFLLFVIVLLLFSLLFFFFATPCSLRDFGS